MKDCYCYLGLHFILLDDLSQRYILKLRDRSLPPFCVPFPVKQAIEDREPSSRLAQNPM